MMLQVPDLSPRARQITLQELGRTQFDLLVVGGGISGAGIAQDAAARGLKVALVERRDFASGTSSKSSKLLHGGLRYLEQFRFHLVHEALTERNLLFDEVPHLARELPFIYPVERGHRLAYLQAWLGIAAYDILGLSTGRHHGRWHRALGEAAVKESEPCLARADLVGGLRYVDGVTDDARLVVEVVKAAVLAGARVANYCPVVGFLRDASGRVEGARVRDEFGDGAEYDVRAHLVINAAGPWVDAVNRLDVPDAPNRLLPTKGVHVVVPAFTRGTAMAIKSLPHPDGRRRWMFVIPWGERSLIGTTDTANPGNSDGDAYLDRDVHATSEEVDYLLGSVNAACPGLDLRPHDVVSAFAGWRPLVAPRGKSFESDISREHEIVETPSGILCLAGGKLTTYRLMARQVVDRAVAILARGGALRGHASDLLRNRPKLVPFGGGTARDLEALAEAGRNLAASASEARLAGHLARVYGAGFRPVFDLARAEPRLAGEIGNLAAESPHWRVQVAFAVRHEAALSVADVLARRMRIQLIDAFQGLGCLAEVAELTAREIGDSLGWDRDTIRRWVETEAAAYEADVKRARAFRNEHRLPDR